MRDEKLAEHVDELMRDAIAGISANRASGAGIGAWDLMGDERGKKHDPFFGTGRQEPSIRFGSVWDESPRDGKDDAQIKTSENV